MQSINIEAKPGGTFWISPVKYHTKRDGSQTVTVGPASVWISPGDQSDEAREYRKSCKLCFWMHGFSHVGWGGVIYRDWPVAGRVWRFYAQ